MVFKKIFVLKNLTDTTHMLAHPNSSAFTLYDGSNFISFKKREICCNAINASVLSITA